MNYFIDAMKNYAKFEGRTGRFAYWMYLLITLAISAVGILIAIAVTGGLGQVSALNTPWGMSPAAFGVSAAIVLVFICPTVAITVRRLHDTGHSAWWISFLIAFLFCFWLAAVLGKEANGSVFDIASAIFGFFSFILFVTNFILLFCADSQHGENQYGPNPKTAK